MKSSIITKILLFTVASGLIISTVYSSILLANLKKDFEDVVSLNNVLTDENKTTEKKLTEKVKELELQKNKNIELEKKVSEVKKEDSGTPLLEGSQYEANSASDFSTTLDSNRSDTNSEETSKEEYSMNKPEFAVYNGNPQRFALNNNLTLDEIYSLNNITDYSELIVGESYRIK